MLTSRQHPPEYIARGIGVGLFVGFTPTTGIQIPILIGLRAALPKRWKFHLPLSMLCTLPTNALTIPFVYYVYVVTGRILMGRTENLRGFDVFTSRMQGSLVTDATWYEQLWLTVVALFQEFGAPLVIGSLPWSLAIAAFGYYASLRFLHKRRGKRRLRRAATGRDDTRNPS